MFSLSIPVLYDITLPFSKITIFNFSPKVWCNMLVILDNELKKTFDSR
ncbi:hypothetical protein VCRA2133O162_140071 [Vibrio crassostreae]|nr:hypothetical protein VCRA2120O150_150071 [Vibrio crassostreae]CAK3780336.1 hypothetical protein VCRA2133O162_140071 [Vibrio crassostreae]CAK3782642.1 hypothetical protein VCRA2120O254_150071 [Vibrio crassostreae]